MSESSLDKTEPKRSQFVTTIVSDASSTPSSQKISSSIATLETIDSSSEDDFIQLEENMAGFRRLMAYYQCALYEVETKFRVLNEEFTLLRARNPIQSIKTRIKSKDSIEEKLLRNHLPHTLAAVENNITDVAGIRVVCSFIDDIYFLEDCIHRQDDILVIKRRDYIEHPKPNGYRSLHLVVEVPIFLHNEKRPMRVEVQLRTIAMEFWANLEHKLRYKKHISEEVSERIASELLACAEESAALDIRMQNVRNIIDET